MRLVRRPAPPGGAAYDPAGLRIQVLPNVVVLREVADGRPVMVVMNCGQISPAHCRRMGRGWGSSRRGWMRLVLHRVESWGWAGSAGWVKTGGGWSGRCGIEVSSARSSW